MSINSPVHSGILRALVTAVVACMLCNSSLNAQAPNPRFGRWLLKSEAAAPASNIMTYEPVGASGMKVTVQSVNARSDTTRWWYTTEFDG